MATLLDLPNHPASVPFMRALGIAWSGGDSAGISLALPWASRASAGDRVDMRAAVALLDYAGGVAVYAGLASVAAATLELRIDVAGPAPAGDVRVDARLVAAMAGSAFVLGEARHGADPPFLHMSARYIAGSGPGQAPAGPGYLAARAARQSVFADVALSAAGCFDDMLDMRFDDDGAWRLPFAPSLVGSITLPAFHGGAVAAALMTAAQAAGHAAMSALGLSSITVQYLRPARAVDIGLRATVIQAGKRAAFIEAGAWQGEILVAKAQALFG